MIRFIFICMALTGALATPALAHTGVGQTSSFASGFAHPLYGVDHMVVMAGVGLLALLAGGRSVWVWPMAFVAAMLAGFAAANLGLEIPFVEPAIASSIIAAGLFVALAVKAPIGLGAATSALFAFFHGHAHGTEVTPGSLIPYAAGFVLATAGLHAAGIGLGLLAGRSIGRIALRAMGGLVALGGIVWMAGGLT